MVDFSLFLLQFLFYPTLSGFESLWERNSTLFPEYDLSQEYIGVQCCSKWVFLESYQDPN